MEPLIIATVMLTFLFAAFLKGTAGLGFATTCLGIMATYADIRLAIPLVIIPSLLSNALVMIDAGGFLRIFRQFWLMYAAAIPGLILGLFILGGGDTTLPRAVLGISMVLYGLYGLWGGRFHLDHTRNSACIVGITTGFVNGLTGSQIMPVLPYLMALDITKDELVQAINTSFTIASIIMLFGLGKLGMLNTEVMLVSAVGVLPVAAGIWLGGKMRRLLPEEAFRRIVLALITLLGAVLIAKAFAA
ncbi:sulfite exporter TauE/SafE family protein [Pseudodesulfovibrio sp. zrk46]|uniref:sulfite exporter TauE/SafE family protein n=1 Tax=Pseudodesulfovibrio sp. zrk46 TaxID=2725288 RepID=UPI001448AA10|nr:sulfite exporter TauE/SafE family protein [Pseudodesulfovibrio sp. zrk46]QJB55557.1 sulfite exporter TauE/SafE family protein [Pseudodesulfovibrio sp. zrk46]